MVRMRLPLNMTPAMWLRHQYSLLDVVDTLNYFRSIHLWQLAVLLCLPIANSSVKLGFSTPVSMHFSSKAQVLTKITGHLSQNYVFPAHEVLDTVHVDHVPSLPVHRIPSAEYQRCKQSVAETMSIVHINRCPRVWTWSGVTMVSLRLEGDALYAMRVVPESVFLRSGRECRSMATTPMRFRVPGEPEVYYGLTDEASFFLPG